MRTESARIVIIGGGIIGCSTAYHLAKLGESDVLLLERNALTSGSTWHAAGLVGQLRSSANITQLLGYSVALYGALEAETGMATGWKRNGGLRLACSRDRWIEVKRQAATARSFGLDMHLLSPREALALWPLMTIDDVVGAAFLPADGQANPGDIAQALARGARKGGVTIREHAPVLAIEVEDGRVCAVRTADARIRTARVVICCGQWTRAVAALAGVNVPLVSVQHQYLITEPIAGVERSMPTLRDPDRLTYYKEEVGGLAMGGYEPNPKLWRGGAPAEDFAFALLDADAEHFEPIMRLALGRVPALAEAGVRRFINGPESFTPDGNFILGEAPETRGVFIGAGFNAFGIASGGGAGMALAEWVGRGRPPYDLWPVDIRRFGAAHRNGDFVSQRTCEAYAKHYAIAWPNEEYSSARPFRRSPLYERLRAAGAVFGEKLGWERPNWFAAPGEEPAERPTFGRPDWFDAVAREHRACRTAAALFDQTSFAKFKVTGSGAEAALSWLCANTIAGPPGTLAYTQMLNAAGGIECDLTVARLAADAFYIVTGTGFATHDFDWIARNLTGDAHIEDITGEYATLALMGPNARAILAAASNADVSGQAFPFRTARWIEVAGARVLALRVTYVGELGWELHAPIAEAPRVYDALKAAGRPHGLADAGYRAIESLRLEKGYRAWGSEIGPDHTPYMAGLGAFVKMKRGGDFLGRAALEDQRRRPLPRLLAGFTVDAPEIVLLGRETIYRDGRRCGWLASGGYGHTIGKAIGYGYVRDAAGVDAAYVMDGAYELDVAGERIAAQPFLTPPYDPENVRVRA